MHLHRSAISCINTMGCCQYIFLVDQWSSTYIKDFIPSNTCWIVAKKCHPWIFTNFCLTSTNNIWDCQTLSTFTKIRIGLPKARIFACSKNLFQIQRKAKIKTIVLKVQFSCTTFYSYNEMSMKAENDRWKSNLENNVQWLHHY